MILGLGLDIVSVSRIVNMKNKFADQFLSRIFTNHEILASKKILSNKKQDSFFAKRFAAKEAFSKALGIGIGKIKFTDIEIYNDENGKPEIRRTTKISKIIKEKFTIEDYQINLSISDDLDIAEAIVIISQNG